MPKRIDGEVKARAVRLVLEHAGEYPTTTAATVAVVKQLGVARESVRRWVVQAQVDAGGRGGRTSEELAEVRELKVRVRRLESDNAILKVATVLFAAELELGIEPGCAVGFDADPRLVRAGETSIEGADEQLDGRTQWQGAVGPDAPSFDGSGSGGAGHGRPSNSDCRKRAGWS